MQRVSTKDVRASLSEIIMEARFGEKCTVVKHHGRQYAAFVPVEISDIIRTAKQRMEQAMNVK